MAFDPKQHLIQLKGKNYLETRWRIAWFREEHPQGCIATEVINYDPVLVKATIYNSEGNVLASAHAGAVDKGNAVWSGKSVEKAETGAIGRALAHAGYGTQFAGSDERPEQNNYQQNGTRDKQAERSRETLASIYSQVGLWFDDDSEAGKKKHMMNVIGLLEREGVITNLTPPAQVVEAIIANRREKTAQQVAQA